MTMSAFPLGRLGDDLGVSILPRGVASPPGVDPIFPVRDDWLRATTDAADKTRLRDWLDREALRLEPSATSPNASVRLRRQHERVVIERARAQREEAEAMALEDALTERVLATSPQTIPGVVAKLQFLVRYGAPGPKSDEFPWPELQSLLRDLQRVTATEWVRFEL